MVLAGTGGVIGLALTLAVGPPVTAYVGAKSFYLPLVAFVFVALLAAAAMGAFVPARRASRLDPNTILRQE
jgi:ABC-type antimicrobial peptide transport system permease subunit